MRERKRHQIHTGEITKVQQHFKEESMVGNIVRKFQNTGQLPQGNGGQPIYLDHTAIGGDYTDMLNKVTSVQQDFEKLPSKIRTRFQNQPAQLLEFLGDEKNRKEAEDLNLIKRPDRPKTGDKIKPSKDKASTPEDSKKASKEAKTE